MLLLWTQHGALRATRRCDRDLSAAGEVTSGAPPCRSQWSAA